MPKFSGVNHLDAVRALRKAGFKEIPMAKFEVCGVEGINCELNLASIIAYFKTELQKDFSEWTATMAYDPSSLSEDYLRPLYLHRHRSRRVLSNVFRTGIPGHLHTCAMWPREN